MKRPTDNRPTTVRWVAIVLVALVVGAGCAASTPDRLESAKVGFIFVGDRDDLGYNEAAWRGSEAVAKAFPDHEVLRRANVPETAKAEEALERLIDEGAGVLFATSFGHLAAAYAVAQRNPEVIVLHQGGIEPTPRLDNFGTYWGTIFETVYQAGIVAGSATTSGRLGFVAAFPIPATFNNVNAFTLGARSVRPDATTEVIFTESWCDPEAQSAAAMRLLASSADVLTQHQDCTRTVLEAAESAGVASVGYHTDGSEVASEGWLVGAVWQWAPLYRAATAAAFRSDFAESAFNGDYRGGISTNINPFVLTELGPSVTDPTSESVSAAAARFAAGDSPFKGPLADRDGNLKIAAGENPTTVELDRVDWFVEGVIGSPG